MVDLVGGGGLKVEEATRSVAKSPPTKSAAKSPPQRSRIRFSIREWNFPFGDWPYALVPAIVGAIAILQRVGKTNRLKARGVSADSSNASLNIYATNSGGDSFCPHPRAPRMS